MRRLGVGSAEKRREKARTRKEEGSGRERKRGRRGSNQRRERDSKRGRPGSWAGGAAQPGS